MYFLLFIWKYGLENVFLFCRIYAALNKRLSYFIWISFYYFVHFLADKVNQSIRIYFHLIELNIFSPFLLTQWQKLSVYLLLLEKEEHFSYIFLLQIIYKSFKGRFPLLSAIGQRVKLLSCFCVFDDFIDYWIKSWFWVIDCTVLLFIVVFQQLFKFQCHTFVCKYCGVFFHLFNSFFHVTIKGFWTTYERSRRFSS